MGAINFIYICMHVHTYGTYKEEFLAINILKFYIL